MSRISIEPSYQEKKENKHIQTEIRVKANDVKVNGKLVTLHYAHLGLALTGGTTARRHVLIEHKNCSLVQFVWEGVAKRFSTDYLLRQET